ncbi:MAG TPA: GIY-YIG nuclease family protein [Bacteroidales bacterium]|jgi:hypothetical protein|nr:GIY-YIG nuclease family protein [Bacteroidales bacterium]
MKTRKELKEEYRQKKFRMGVFKIVNSTNGKIFLGSSTDLDTAWNSHRFRLKAGLHENYELQKDWIQFGEQAFDYLVVEELKIKEGDDPGKELKAFEKLLIEELQPFGEKGYHFQRISR